MPTCWINTPKYCSHNTSQILIIDLTIKKWAQIPSSQLTTSIFSSKETVLCCPRTHICYQFSFNISTHVPTQVHWWMSIMFTQSAQWWKYLLCLKTLQRPAFLVACWVQTGQFQIWPVPTSQGYKSTMLSLIKWFLKWKLFQILLNFRKVKLFFKIYLCNIDIGVKVS